MRASSLLATEGREGIRDVAQSAPLASCPHSLEGRWLYLASRSRVAVTFPWHNAPVEPMFDERDEGIGMKVPRSDGRAIHAEVGAAACAAGVRPRCLCT